MWALNTKGVESMEDYTAYIKTVIMETIEATEDRKLLQYIYTMLMSALSSPGPDGQKPPINS